MFRLSAVFAVVFTLVLAAPVPARADLVTESATLQYSPGSKFWAFVAPSVTGQINIVGKSIAKQLAKLKLTGATHICDVTYDNDSKVAANNGDFYSVFKVAKCDQ